MMNENAIYTYSTAKGFVQSAMLVISSLDRFQLPNDSTIVLSFHHLIGFAVELYLKAYLLNSGVSEETLRSKAMGHNLDALLAASVEHGLSEKVSRDLVEYVGPKHKSFEYRYIKEDSSYEVRDLNWIFGALSDLDNAVDAAVGASASHSQTPGGRWSITPDRARWRIPAAK